MTLSQTYQTLKNNYLNQIACELEAHILDLLKDEEIARVDRVSVRAKGVESFEKKSQKTNHDGDLKYQHPLTEIQDLVGARITVFFQSDVRTVCKKVVDKYFSKIESQDKVPDTEAEFGYFGKHFILKLPDDVLPAACTGTSEVPNFFELQIKTLFQHAWSEANHDVGYKTVDGERPKDLRRRIAFASAQAWGADRIFEEIFCEVTEEVPNNETEGKGH
jgi:putative GTP pyrophosphokinase